MECEHGVNTDKLCSDCYEDAEIADNEHNDREIRREDLKSCPFCGAPPMLHGRLGRFNVLHSCDAIKTNIGAGKKDYVIAKWNTRADTDEVRNLQDTLNTAGFLLADEKAEVARLREALGEVYRHWLADHDPAEIPELCATVRQLLNNKGPAE